MNKKTIHYIFAGASFLIAFLVYLSTMQPSIPFWDCGEFAAAAWGLQIPHPPGSPLWTLVGRFAMMLPTFDDPVARYNLFSVLSSAATIMILYLTVVRLIKLWRGAPRSMADVMTHYGGGFVAAMSYTFTDSFWFNALECEVYAFGSLFIALVPWIMLVWYDHADEDHSEKYLLLASYIIGLSLGVHQLALLTIFGCFMLIYYRRREKTSIASFLGMVGASIIAFLISYKIILVQLVEWLGETPVITYALLAGTIAGIIYSQKQKKPVLNLSLWAGLLIFLGYSTYALIMVRAAQEPPMNQWHASNFVNIKKFINREQYGSRDFLPRRYPNDENKMEGPTWENYTSDGDFFLKYQTQHMYNRYFAWNFIGRVSQRQDAGVDITKTLMLPFLLGLFGMFWHFRRDPKRALTMFTLFAMLGWLTAWYQNQQDPQPRERDYFYVGAFYMYAMWVGIGATGLAELLRARKKKENDDEETVGESDTTPILVGGGSAALAGGVIAVSLLIAPINQAVGLAGLLGGKSFEQSSKWAMYDRSHNHIPLEAAYNVLQSCEPDAILFTAGDNDTFPLWCAQDVYGIRRDVRIVNLSLANMSWNIKQFLVDQWGIGKKINLPGFTKEMLDGADDTQQGVHPYASEAKQVIVNITPETMRKYTGAADAAGTQMRWMMTGQFQIEQGRYYVAVSDQVVKAVIEGNINSRPIYFANMVQNNYLIGLNPYLVSEGLVRRVAPIVQTGSESRLEGAINERAVSAMLMEFVNEPVTTPKRAMLLNTFSDPKAHWENDDRTNEPYFFSYQLAYLNLARYYERNQALDECRAVLDTMVRRMPPDRMQYLGVTAQTMMRLYKKIGDKDKALLFGEKALVDLNARIAANQNGNDPETFFGAHLLVAEINLELDRPQEVIDRLKPIISSVAQQDQALFQLRLMQAEARVKEKKGDKQGALDAYTALMNTFGQAMANSAEFQGELQQFAEKRLELMQALGQKIDSSTMVVR